MPSLGHVLNQFKKNVVNGAKDVLDNTTVTIGGRPPPPNFDYGHHGYHGMPQPMRMEQQTKWALSQGDYQGAQQAALGADYRREACLDMVAQHALSTGNYTAAFNAAAPMADVSRRNGLMLQAGQGAVNSGQLGLAQAVVSTINASPSYLRPMATDSLQANLSAALVRMGDPRAALTATQGMYDHFALTGALAPIVSAAVSQGDRVTAQAAANRMDPGSRKEALRQIDRAFGRHQGGITITIG